MTQRGQYYAPFFGIGAYLYFEIFSPAAGEEISKYEYALRPKLVRAFSSYHSNTNSIDNRGRFVRHCYQQPVGAYHSGARAGCRRVQAESGDAVYNQRFT
jgi:hypothetical protein